MRDTRSEVDEALSAAGARRGPDGALRFSTAAKEAEAMEREPVAAPLEDDRVIHVAGGDAHRFLQAQLPTDVPPPGSDRALLAACCTVTGRVVAVFELAARSSGYLLRLPASAARGLIERLARYRLRSRVEFLDRGWHAFGVAGPGAAGALEAVLGAVPDPGRCAETEEEAVVARSFGGGARFTLFVPSGRFRRICDTLLGHLQPVGPETFRLAELREGLPWIHEETAGQFVPQMLGLERMGAVSFSKGCYPGQEVVARTQHLGTVKRVLVRAALDAGGEVPRPGTTLFSGDGRPAGHVLYAARAAAGIEALAVVARDLAGGPWRAGEPDGPSLRLTGRPRPDPGEG
ncbi:MAG: folate-binding protein [Acidobacteria bacterium]|nr:MAG: folate-binding protein [Acidobacteriota bacterium]